MTHTDPKPPEAYIAAAAALLRFTGRPEVLAPILARIASFAADLESYALGDDVEMAPGYRP